MRATARPPKHLAIIADYTEAATLAAALIGASARRRFPITFFVPCLPVSTATMDGRGKAAAWTETQRFENSREVHPRPVPPPPCVCVCVCSRTLLRWPARCRRHFAHARNHNDIKTDVPPTFCRMRNLGDDCSLLQFSFVLQKN